MAATPAASALLILGLSNPVAPAAERRSLWASGETSEPASGACRHRIIQLVLRSGARRLDTLIRQKLSFDDEDAYSAGEVGFLARALVQATLPLGALLQGSDRGAGSA